MSLKISRILHAGYVFECDKTQIAFDPIFENPFSQNCYAFPEVRFDHDEIKELRLDAVFISHFHDDHCSLESLNFLDRSTPIYVYCVYEELFEMIKELGFHHVCSLKINQSVTVGSFEIIPIRALDFDVDSIFHIKAAGLNVLNVVDSWMDPSTLELLARSAPWDMVLWPFQTMREIEVIAPFSAEPAPKELPQEWIEQLKILNPRFIVPSSCQFIHESWSWYNHALFPISYQNFRQEIESILLNSQVIRLNPSVSVVLDKDNLVHSAVLNWVKPVGEQNVDYEYDKDLKPPSTAEISRNFAKLSEKQTLRIYDYCRAGLINKYNSLEPTTESYFNSQKFWKLSIYDHIGDVVHFYYELYNGKMKQISEKPLLLSWTTEIPISKFYAALETGESLTSMYLRINDMEFAQSIKKEICEVDIIYDPLIRCLFDGTFGAYQMAQLKKIKSAIDEKKSISLIPKVLTSLADHQNSHLISR